MSIEHRLRSLEAWRADLRSALGECGYQALQDHLRATNAEYRELSSHLAALNSPPIANSDVRQADEYANALERLLDMEALAQLSAVVDEIEREGDKGIDREWVDEQARLHSRDLLRRPAERDDHHE